MSRARLSTRTPRSPIPTLLPQTLPVFPTPTTAPPPRPRDPRRVPRARNGLPPGTVGGWVTPCRVARRREAECWAVYRGHDQRGGLGVAVICSPIQAHRGWPLR